jgi:hypothetical protein
MPTNKKGRGRGDGSNEKNFPEKKPLFMGGDYLTYYKYII